MITITLEMQLKDTKIGAGFPMIEVTEGYIDSLAPNSGAIKNAQGLVKKGSFVQLNRSDDGELLFGECAGSGSSNYQCSADFIHPEKPVLRCSCPSRQLPCKHSLGLLYAYASGKPFDLAPIPDDVAAKREKAEKREEQKARREAEGAEEKPRTVNKSALKKKIQAQLDGLGVLDKFVQSLVRNGIATIDAKGVKTIHEHVKQLGNYYLTGAQVELRRFALLLAEDDEREANYTKAVEQLATLHAFVKKGRAYLQSKLIDPELKPDSETTIEEWLGHAWQLTELKEAGLVSDDTELLQLAFMSYDDRARQEYVDLGYWMELGQGTIHRTVQYRPYKAAKHIREEDSFFDVAKVRTLYLYPGGLNRRIRFDELTSRIAAGSDAATAAKQAQRSVANVIKTVKNELKNPLGEKAVAVLVHASEIKQAASGGHYVLIDETGGQLQLEDRLNFTRSTTSLLPLIPTDALSNIAVLVLFANDLDSGKLAAQPLSIINNEEIIRLLY